MAVYDDQDQKLVSDDDLRNLTGINPDQEGAMDREAGQVQPSGSARDILGRERAAAVGKPQLGGGGGGKTGGGNMSQPGRVSSGNSPSLADKLSSFGTGVRDSLKAKENQTGFYKPQANDYPVASRAMRIRKRVATAGALSALIGGGGGFALFGTVSGPLQFIHAGELFSKFHLDEKNDQGNSRVLKMARNIRYTFNGQYERTRLGFLGNHLANRVERKMNAHGVTTVYDGGAFKGYIVDPKVLAADEHIAINANDPNESKAFLKDRYGINAVVGADGKLFVAPTGSFFADRKLMKTTIRLSGVRYVSPLSLHVMGKRNLITWHPITKKVGKADEKYRAWVKDQFKKIKQGSGPPAASAKSAVDKDGKPVQNADPSVDTVNEISQQGTQTAADLADGKTESKAKFKNFLTGKLVGGATGALGLLCIILAVADNIDVLNQANVIVPMIRMGMQAVTLAGQITSGGDVDLDQLGYFSGLYFGSSERGIAKSSWIDGKSVQAERGQPLSGEDIPPTARLDQQGNFFTAVRDGTPKVVKDACVVLGGAVGIILTIAFVAISPIGGLIQTVLGAAIAAVAVDLLADYFSAETVSVTAAGMARGNFMNYGVRLAANDVGVSRGGLALPNADAKVLTDARLGFEKEEFSHKSLAYRLFNSEDPKSVFSQVIDSQAPSPGENVAHVATGFLDLGRSFGTILTKPLLQKAGAYPSREYDYGFPDIGFSKAEMDDTLVDNPFENANLAADILDANTAEQPLTVNILGAEKPNPDNYIVRAKQCFGMDIVKKMTAPTDGTAPVEQYTIKPPTPGQTITTATVVDADDVNHCNEGHQTETASLKVENGKQAGKSINVRSAAAVDWTRIRFYLFDSQMMNSYACYEGDQATSEDDKQACIDAGVLTNPDIGATAGGINAWDSSTGVPTCATTAVSSAPSGYKLSSCDDFEGTSLDASTFEAYDGGGGDTVSGAGRQAGQCTVAGSFFTLTQAANGATCGSSSSYNQREGYWEVRMRTKAIDGGSSTAHPVLILWPGTDVWADGELDYFETDIGEPGGGFLHCVGNPADNCYTIPDGGNTAITPTPAGYAEWHSYGLQWTSSSMTGYIDGQQWWTSTDGSFRPSTEMHQTIQLDNLSGDGSPNPAQMQVDWVHVYCQPGIAGCTAGAPPVTGKQ